MRALLLTAVALIIIALLVGQPYFDPNAFAPVTDVRFGNSGRNIVRGPGFVQPRQQRFPDIQID